MAVILMVWAWSTMLLASLFGPTSYGMGVAGTVVAWLIIEVIFWTADRVR